MRSAMLSLLAAGCGASTAMSGPCAPGNPCGSGEICDLTDPDGPTCISATGDLDGDGIPNGKDFCEHAAGGAYDEDGDGIGDDCDRCPIAAPPETPDADGDAVDSPCDPDTHEPGDQILLFDGFHDLATTWKTTTAAAWQVQGGEVIASLAAVPGVDYLSTGVIAKTNLAVEASYRVDSVETSATTHQVFVYAADPRPAGVATMECGVVHADAGSGDVIDLETDVNNATKTTSGAFDSARLYRAGAYATGNSVGCSIVADAAPLGAVQAPITPDALTAIALGARAVTVRFQWILVVGR